MTLYLNENRPLRLGTLCTLYAAQGIPDGFVQIALKNHLIHLGVTTNAVGNIVAMVSWPWSLKFLWGPVIDRYGYSPLGRRRPWILLAQVLMAITLLGMLFIPNISTNLRMLAFMVLLVNVFASLQDVSVDALAVDLLPAKERGLANGFMYGSNYAGSYFGGQMLGTYILQYGFSAAVKLQSVVLMCIAAVPLLLRERRGDALLPGQRGDPVLRSASAGLARPTSLSQVFRLWNRAFSLRSTRLAAVLAILSSITVKSHFIFWPVHVQRQLGWSQERWLTLEGGYAVWFGLVGSLVGGALASLIGAKRTVILSITAMSGCWFAYALASSYWTNANVVSLLYLAETALGGFLQVSMFAMFMGLCWPPVAATQFTTFMALLNVSNGLGAIVADKFETSFTMSGAHVALGCMQIVLIAIVLAINPDETRQKLGEAEIVISPGPQPEAFPTEPRT